MTVDNTLDQRSLSEMVADTKKETDVLMNTDYVPPRTHEKNIEAARRSKGQLAKSWLSKQLD